MKKSLKEFVEDYQKCFTINQRKYLGNKTNLINNFIDKTIAGYLKSDNILTKDDVVLFDIFAGTGSVANFVKSEFNLKVIANDYLYHNYLAYLTFFCIKTEEEYLYLISLIEELNELEGIKGYCTKNWSDKYFSSENCMKIDAVREKIEELKDIPFKIKAGLITSLIYAVDKVANIAGIYTKWISGEDPSSKSLELKIPLIDIKNNSRNEHMVKNELAEKIIGNKTLDYNILYIDPPYFKRSYYEFYHVLENIARWEKPDLFFSSLREKWTAKCKTGFKGVDSTEKNFEDIINKATDNKNCKMIIMSYSNHGVMHPKIIKNKLETFGKTTICERECLKYSNGRGNFKADYKELLYISKC